MKRTENYKEYVKTTNECATDGCARRVNPKYEICY